MIRADPPPTAFQAGNPGKLPVPRRLGCIMLGAFSLPAVMLVATTWRTVPEYPWLLLVYLASTFPLVVLLALKRLMSRYALRVYQDGGVDVVLPFKTVRVPRERLAAVSLASNYVAAINARQAWIVLTAHDGTTLATFSPDAFDANTIERFFAALREVNPAVRILNSA